MSRLRRVFRNVTQQDAARRLWVDHTHNLQAARHRDRNTIEDALHADEGPRFNLAMDVPAPPPVQEEQPEPERFPRTRPVKMLHGWEFVESMRTRQGLAGIPSDLVEIWKAIEYDFDYERDIEARMLVLSTNGKVLVTPHAYATLDDWLFFIWHVLLHAALGHIQPPDDVDARLWVLACESIVNYQVQSITNLALPNGFVTLPQQSGRVFNPFLRRMREPVLTPQQQIEKWEQQGAPKIETWRTPAGWQQWDVVGEPNSNTIHYRSLYTLGKVRQLQPQETDRSLRYAETAAGLAYHWFVEHFPLLSSAAAAFTIDYETAPKKNIAVAAVNAGHQKIYVNLEADLTEMEWRFVLGHEILHVVLEHHQRLGERDPMVWNLACDYVINNWLVQMGVGVTPPKGGLYKKEYAGLDAETIYNQLIENGGNDQLELETFRGNGMGDILDFDDDFRDGGGNGREGRRNPFRATPRHMTQDAARKLLEDRSNGLMRGDIPGDLIEELDLGEMLQERVEVPEWKADLAEWFRIQFTPKPPRRSYMRPSRRQASVPDIPRPGKTVLDYHSPTFGVVLDTSGSMSHELLQKGLAAMIAFSEQHGVVFVRFIMCDTRPFDEGFVPIRDLKKSYRIFGRGGTALQPAVELLEKAKDFPKDAPILVITDGAIDVLTVKREHAFLLPGEGELPFEPKGPVFRILGDNRGRFFGRRFPFPRSNESKEKDGDDANQPKRFSGFRPRTPEEQNQQQRSPFRRPSGNSEGQPPRQSSAGKRDTQPPKGKVSSLIDRIKKL